MAKTKLKSAGTPTPPTTGSSVRMAYLMSQYPAVSHTFFLREVLGLRQLGFHIQTASINTPHADVSSSESAEAAEFAATFYIKQHGAAAALRTALLVLLLQPAVFVRGVRATFRLRPQRPRGWAFAAFYFLEALLLGEWMRREQLRHLHVHFATAVATVGCIAAAAYSIPVSLTVHGSDEFFDASLYALPEKIAQASFIVCISDFCRSQLMCLSSPQHWDKMHIARLGVDPKEFSPAVRRTKSSAKRPVEMLCVGRLVAAKGHRVLLESIAQLRNSGANVHLTLAGDGPLRNDLEAYVAQHGLESTVHFAGSCSRSQTRKLLASADIFVLASFAEGVPVALMEAMAMSLPCVSTQIAGIPELITNQQSGVLVSPSSVPALTAAIADLLHKPAAARKLGAAARKQIGLNYNLPKNLNRLATLFQQQLQGGHE